MGFSWIGANRWADEVIQNKKDQEEFNKRVRLQREEAILASYIKNSGPSGTGTNKRPGALEKATKLQDRIDDLNISDEGLRGYFDNILSDPYAAADVMDFLEDQAKNYDRVIKLQDLPNIINIVNSPASTQEKFDLIKELDVVDLTNKNDYLKLATKVANMTGKEGRTVFIDVPETVITKTDYTAREKQFEGVLQEVVRAARVGLENNPNRVEVANAIRNLDSSNPEVRAKARDYLLSTTITEEFITSLENDNPTAYRGLSKNYLIKPYITISTPQNEVTYPTPPAEAIAALQNNPNLKRDFELKYGPGSADEYL